MEKLVDKAKELNDELERLRLQLESKEKEIQAKDDELQSKYDDVAELRMQLDDTKKELHDQSTNFKMDSDVMKRRLENEKREAEQYENELISLKSTLDPNMQAAATSIGVNTHTPSWYMASTMAASVNTFGMSSATSTHAPTFVSASYSLPISTTTMFNTTAQHVNTTSSSINQRSCLTCEKFKPSKENTKANLQSINSYQVLDLVELDFIGPLTPTKQGHKYILSVIDHYSKYAVAYATLQQNTNTVIDCLKQYFSQFGIPERILTDQGRCFISQPFQDFLNLWGIAKATSTSYHPETQGLVERFNGTIISILKRYVYEMPDTWDENLPLATFAYNTSIQRVNNYTPHEVMYGRKAKTSISTLVKNNSKLSPTDHVLKVQRDMQRGLRLQQQHIRTYATANLFMFRAAREWNCLPLNVVSSATLTVFKNRLHSWLMDTNI